MPHLDRTSFIELLDRLGDPDDAVVLAAARSVDARVRDSGWGWDGLLVPPRGAEPAATEAALAPPQANEEIGSLLDRLLASDLSAVTREELTDFKRDLAAGELPELDRKYIRDLADRLSRKTD